MTNLPFWRAIPLAQMNTQQWESLCDGCAKCCLHKLEDIETDIVYYTDVACRLLDINSCRCTNYPLRQSLVPSCVVIDRKAVQQYHYLPSTCAYRLLAEGRDLPHWHPLVSGNNESVHLAGESVRGRVSLERADIDLEDHIVDWPL